MSKYETKATRKSVVKRTTQGGRVRTAGLNKTEKRSYKRYRGQGR